MLRSEQGDLEKSMGLPISAFCNRNEKTEERSQKGFLEFLVQPLVVQYTELVDNRMWMEQFEHNLQYWKQRLAERERVDALKQQQEPNPS